MSSFKRLLFPHEWAGGNDRNRRFEQAGRIVAGMNITSRSWARSPVPSARRPSFYFRLFNGKRRARPGVGARDSGIRECSRKQNSGRQRREADQALGGVPVRFAKISAFCLVRLAKRLVPWLTGAASHNIWSGRCLPLFF
jgi:hypothetical protein